MHAAAQMQAAPLHCTFCAVALTTDQILYTPDARIVCAQCSARIDLVATDRNVGGNILKAGVFSISSAALGFVMFFFPALPFLIFGLALEALAAWAGIYALRAVNRKGDERFTQHVASARGAIYTTAIIGLAMSVLIGVVLAFSVSNRITKVKDGPAWQKEQPRSWDE
jgi:hypothetical protein